LFKNQQILVKGFLNKKKQLGVLDVNNGYFPAI